MTSLPESLIPRLKAEYDVDVLPRVYKQQTLELTREEFLALKPGAGVTENGVTAIVFSASAGSTPDRTMKYHATFDFYPFIQ